MNRKIAFFIDGGFFIHRIKYFQRKHFPNHPLEPSHIIKVLYAMVQKHQKMHRRGDLYRIYYYDAPPFEDQMREPVLREGERGLKTKAFSKDPNTIFHKELHKQLGSCRKLALRMGELSNAKEWQIKSYKLKSLLKGECLFEDLTPDDFHLALQQKGVDTRIGIDISTLTLNKFSDTIVLVAGDADFVPAAKLARTHGVDVVLDPMWGNIANELDRHIDGKKSFDIVRLISDAIEVEPEFRPNWWD